MNWIEISDYLFASFILFYLIGQRFNQWPEESDSQLSGKPYDYIDRKRYFTYFLLYILTFVVLGIVLKSSNFLIPQNLKVSEVYKGIVENLGNSSFTAISLFLLAFVNDNNLKKLDSKWRDCLQKFASIPKAVEELKYNIISKKDSLQPLQGRLEIIQDEMKFIGVAEYWNPRIDNWQIEYEKLSINWQYLKTIYALHICKDLRVSALNVADIDRYERRLHDLARVIPTLKETDKYKLEYMEELDKFFRQLIESICKHVIKRNPSKSVHYNDLQNFGFYPSYHDIQEINLSYVVINCIIIIAIITYLTIFGYLKLLTHNEIPYRAGEEWYTRERLLMWFKGSLVSYSVAIFIAIFIEKLTSEDNVRLKFTTYINTILFSTLGSLGFFLFVNKEVIQHLNWNAFPALAMTFSVVSIAVLKALQNTTLDTSNEVIVTSLKYALIFGLIACFFQIYASQAFRGGWSKVTFLAYQITAIYGFVKAFSVIFVISYVIQESIRRQLLVAQRESPRRRVKTRLSVFLEGNAYKVAVKDISNGGLRIGPGKPFKIDQIVDVGFKFGAIKAKVQWISKRSAGLEFIKSDPNIDELYCFIRKQFSSIPPKFGF